MAGLLPLLLLPVLMFASDVKLPRPTYSGRLPDGFCGFAVLDSSHAHYWLTGRDDRLVACALEQGVFVPRCSLPRLGEALNGNDTSRATGFVMFADADNDGIQEILVAVNRTISKYKWLGGALALTAVASIRADPGSGRLWMTDGEVGDVNNDGRNEVLIAATGSRPPACGGDSASPAILLVCRWDGDSLVQLWNDGGALELEQPSYDLPSEVMYGIADLRNTGTNRLILLEGTGDDVHAAEYREVLWRDGRFTDDGSFLLRDGQLQHDCQDNDPFNSATGISLGQVGGKTAILADIEHGGGVWQEELFVFSGDSATQDRVLWSDEDEDLQSPSTGILIDIDGHGVGALRFLEPWKGGPRFEFYRL